MAIAKKLPPVPKDLPQDNPTPTIEFTGEGAEKVLFTVNPKAVKYVVHVNGMVKEYL